MYTGAGERLHLTSGGLLDFTLLQLPGSDWWLRIESSRPGLAPVRLADEDGKPALAAPACTATPINGGGMNVRLLVPGTGELAKWGIDQLHVLRYREVPVTLPGVLPGLRVRVDYDYPHPAADAVTVSHKVVDESGRARADFAAGLLPEGLARAHPDGVTLIARTTGTVFHLDGWGRELQTPAAIQEPVPPAPTDFDITSSMPDSMLDVMSEEDIRAVWDLVSAQDPEFTTGYPDGGEPREDSGVEGGTSTKRRRTAE